jgi:hypothetical protein
MAENIREHSIEHKRAKQFAASLINDLREDTAGLISVIGFGENKMRAVDSLVFFLTMPPAQWRDAEIYRYEGIAGRVRTFAPNTGTYDQMKSSGSLRYFKQGLTDLLNQYAVQAKKVESREYFHINYAANLLNPFIAGIMDARALINMQNGKDPGHPLTFRKSDPETVAVWINYATITQSTQERTVVEYLAMLEKARVLIAALRKEYHIF